MQSVPFYFFCIRQARLLGQGKRLLHISSIFFEFKFVGVVKRACSFRHGDTAPFFFTAFRLFRSESCSAAFAGLNCIGMKVLPAAEEHPVLECETGRNPIPIYFDNYARPGDACSVSASSLKLKFLLLSMATHRYEN